MASTHSPVVRTLIWFGLAEEVTSATTWSNAAPSKRTRKVPLMWLFVMIGALAGIVYVLWPAKPYDVRKLAANCPAGKVHAEINLTPVPALGSDGKPNEHSGLNPDGTIKDGYLERAAEVALARAATCGYPAYITITDPATGEQVTVLSATFEIQRKGNRNLQGSVRNVVAQAIERAKRHWHQAHLVIAGVPA